MTSHRSHTQEKRSILGCGESGIKIVERFSSYEIGRVLARVDIDRSIVARETGLLVNERFSSLPALGGYGAEGDSRSSSHRCKGPREYRMSSGMVSMRSPT